MIDRFVVVSMALTAAISLTHGEAVPPANREDAPVDPARGLRPFSVADLQDGLSLHEDMYLLPATWSEQYRGRESEAVFQLSAKLRIFDTRLFFGYTQVAFWQPFNEPESRPFRETNYNPQLFYRFTPSKEELEGWVVDVGVEHYSNGQSEPESRSWNRAYATLHYQQPRHLLSMKLWYRFEEDECPIGNDGLELDSCRDESGYDDNPHITDFVGYNEFHYRYRWGSWKRPQDIHFMGHGNLATGKGGVGLDYSIAGGSKDLHWFVKAWHGYGESLIDHDLSITRFGFGLLFRRTYQRELPDQAGEVHEE